MENQAMLNLLNKVSDPRFVTSKWNICNKEVLKSNLCNYNDAYILIRSGININGQNQATEVIFKNYAPFIKCITKIINDR